MSDIKIYDDDPIQSVDGINRLTLERAKNSALAARLAEAEAALTALVPMPEAREYFAKYAPDSAP